MSQSGPLTVSGMAPIPPTVATEYDADIGFAVPAANILNILGDVSSPGGVPVHTEGLGNTITTFVQIASAIPATDVTDIGLAAFDDTYFTVDPNGFVSLAASGIVLGVRGNDGMAVGPAVDGYIGLNGRVVDNAFNLTPIFFNQSLIIPTQENLDIQLTTAADLAVASTLSVGLACFNEDHFTVNPINGGVSILGMEIVIPGAYPYTIIAANSAIIVDTSAARTINMPAIPATGQLNVIKDGSGTANVNNITVQGNGNNIDGAASQTMNVSYQSMTLIWNGTQWNRI